MRLIDRIKGTRRAVTRKKKTTANIIARKRVPNMASMVTKKDTRKAPRRLAITKRHIPTITTKSTNSTTARRRRATIRNTVANTSSTNRRKANTRKARITSLDTKKPTKVCIPNEDNFRNSYILIIKWRVLIFLGKKGHHKKEHHDKAHKEYEGKHGHDEHHSHHDHHGKKGGKKGQNESGYSSKGH